MISRPPPPFLAGGGGFVCAPDSSTNLAFFDGHVGLYDTLPFTRRAPSKSNENMLLDLYTDTIFYLNKQRGK